MRSASIVRHGSLKVRVKINSAGSLSINITKVSIKAERRNVGSLSGGTFSVSRAASQGDAFRRHDDLNFPLRIASEPIRGGGNKWRGGWRGEGAGLAA